MMEPNNDILIVEDINSKGYGMIPKMVMQDKKLSISAKAIYAYFSSFAGAGDQAFPKREQIYEDLGIGKNAYYKHLNKLKACGYIKVEQKKRKGGKMSHNIYILPSAVHSVIPCPEKGDTEPSPDSSDPAPSSNSPDMPPSLDSSGIAPSSNSPEIASDSSSSDISPCPENEDATPCPKKEDKKPCPEKGDTEPCLKKGDTARVPKKGTRHIYKINKRPLKLTRKGLENIYLREGESARESGAENNAEEEIKAELAKLAEEFGEDLTAEYMLKAENWDYSGLMAVKKAKEWLMADKRTGKIKKPAESSDEEKAIRAELVREFGEKLTAEYMLKADTKSYSGLTAVKKAREWLMADIRTGKTKKPARPPSYDIEKYERLIMSMPISYQENL